MNKFFIILMIFITLGHINVAFADSEIKSADIQHKQLEKATFAGGCFWCMQPPFDKLEGVISTTVGYTGGPEKSPTYKEVSYGKTGHAESIEVIYDPTQVSY